MYNRRTTDSDRRQKGDIPSPAPYGTSYSSPVLWTGGDPRGRRCAATPGYLTKSIRDMDSHAGRRERSGLAYEKSLRDWQLMKRGQTRYRAPPRDFDHFFQIAGSASILMNTPPITGRAWKPRIRAFLRPVPVGQRHAVGRVADEVVDRLHQLLEIGPRIGQRGRPYLPVGLGVARRGCPAAGRSG